MTRATQLVGIGGQKEHGKDAFARELAALGGRWRVLGMSDPLLDAFLLMNPWVMVDPYLGLTSQRNGDPVHGAWQAKTLVEAVGFTAAKRVPEVRRMLQVLGTDIVRKANQDAWVDATRRSITAAFRQGESVIVTGIRFPNELNLITAMGGRTVWVERPGHPAAPGAAHVSEHALTMDDFDRLVINDGTLDDLRQQAAFLLDAAA
ncbi:deoxynucleotide monophosphate kinase family protein [Leucobacter sp. HY1910]